VALNAIVTFSFFFSEDDLRIELQAEIERGKTMASKLQRLPPASAAAARPRTVNGLSSTDDLKLGEIIKFYEDLTNLIVPNMKLQKGKYLGTDEWFLNCVYSYVDEGAKNEKPVDSRSEFFFFGSKVVSLARTDILLLLQT
jgi:hypothetical protein